MMTQSLMEAFIDSFHQCNEGTGAININFTSIACSVETELTNTFPILGMKREKWSVGVGDGMKVALYRCLKQVIYSQKNQFH